MNAWPPWLAESGGLRPRAGWAPVLRRYGVLLAFGVLLIAMIAGSPSFLSLRNFVNILSQWTPVGIMAVGATYVILAGGFDLSAASGYALCSVVTALVATRLGLPPEIDFLGSLVVGAAIGALNAFLVVGLKINPFIATLGSGFVLNGVPFVIVKDPFINVQQPGFDTLGTGTWHGIPYAAMLLVGLFVIAGIVLAKTPYGQRIYAVGGNADTSRLFGIRVSLVIASTYVFSGFCMGVAAAVGTSQLNYSSNEQDPALIFNVIVAVVVGGTSLNGGFGSIWRTAVGLGILAIMQNGLNLLEVNAFSQYIVKGFIIVGAVGFDGWMRSLASSAKRRARPPRDSMPPSPGGDNRSRPDLTPASRFASINAGNGGMVR
jgi:ribose transport system permease protein